MGERWLGKRGYIEFFIVDGKNGSKINQLVEKLDEEDVKLGEPTIEAMDSLEEALVD